MIREEIWLLYEKHNGKKTDAFYTDCARLRAGEPIAYVIGTIPFLGTQIRLDSLPLIPRTETEFWVEKAIAEIGNDPRESPRILDLCAGSGAIGVAVLAHIPRACVDFAELDEAHHQTIRANVVENGIDPDRAHIFGGDLFERTAPPYDYILTNPPYIAEGSTRVEPSVLAYEPKIALFGGPDGFSLIERVIDAAPAYLTSTGVLFLEHDPEQAPKIQALAAKRGFTAVTHLDQFGHERYTVLSRMAEGAVAQ